MPNPSGMKKVFVTKLTDVRSTDVEGVNTLRWEGAKLYKWVRLQNVTATVAGVAGDMVAFFKETGGEDGRVVTDNTDADAKPIPAGMLLGTVAGVLAVAEYCWIQVQGHATVNQTILDTPADGDELALSTTDKTLAVAKYSGTTPNIVRVLQPAGYGNDVSAKKVILNCPI